MIPSQDDFFVLQMSDCIQNWAAGTSTETSSRMFLLVGSFAYFSFHQHVKRQFLIEEV